MWLSGRSPPGRKRAPQRWTANRWPCHYRLKYTAMRRVGPCGPCSTREDPRCAQEAREKDAETYARPNRAQDYTLGDYAHHGSGKARLKDWPKALGGPNHGVVDHQFKRIRQAMSRIGLDLSGRTWNYMHHRRRAFTS